MSLVISKVGMPSEENIVTRANFIANKIIPVGIRVANVEGSFIFLFKAIQDYDDSEKYFQIIMTAEDMFYYDKVKEYHLYINRMKDKDKEIYHKHIEGIKNNPSKIYGTDFCFIKDDEHRNYYRCNAVRAVDQTHAEVLDVYISSDMYIRIRVYLSNITQCMIKYYAARFEYVFIDRLFHEIKILDVSHVEYNGTTQYMDAVNTSHYTMYCSGPKAYKMNFNTLVSQEFKEKPLSNPITYEDYNAIYEKDFYITEIVLEDDDGVLLIWAEYDDKQVIKNPHALKLTKELVNKTNFLDDNNVIYYKEEASK